MGKKTKKKKEIKASRDEARAGDGQIVRIGEKEKCSDCKNWIPWGFGTPPFRAECGPGANCVSFIAWYIYILQCYSHDFTMCDMKCPLLFFNHSQLLCAAISIY